MKPIETIYKGYRFRSRAEARWAVFFDNMGMDYLYEPEGFTLSDGTMYLPDFYLPQSKSYFEVKGVMDEQSDHKIRQFIKDGNNITIGYPDMTFNACDNFVGWGSESDNLAGIAYSWLCRCESCGSAWFMGASGFFECRCCGEYNGDHHFAILLQGDATDFLEDADARKNRLLAKQARFEHGEVPA